jgi:hypothetical protein
VLQLNVKIKILVSAEYIFSLIILVRT